MTSPLSISLHARRVFLTYMPRTHVVLYLRRGRFFFTWVKVFLLMYLALRFHHGRFFLTQVVFFRFTHLTHICPCASSIMDFFSCGLEFLNLRALSIFGFTLLSWWIYVHAHRVFLSHLPQYILLVFMPWLISLCTSWVFPTYVLQACLALDLYCDRFFFTWYNFSQLMHLKHILSFVSTIIYLFLWIRFFQLTCLESPCASIVIKFSSHGSYFPNLCVLCTISFMSLPW